MKKALIAIGVLAGGYYLLKPKKEDLQMSFNGNNVDYKVIANGKVINKGSLAYNTSNVDTTIGDYRIKSNVIKVNVSGIVLPVAIEIVVFKKSYEILNGVATFNDKAIQYNKQV